MSSSHKKLNSRLKEIIPSAELEVMTLPNVPELKLFLLAKNYPQGALSEQEMQRVMNNPLYWVFCWASGEVLARYLLDHPEQVSGKRILDFGCGSGVVAIAAAIAGAGEVIACDIDPLALEATAVNARLNGIDLQLCDDYFDIEGEVDLIIVADVLYDSENFVWLERFSRRAPRVLVADSRVKNFDYPPFSQIDQMDSCTLPDLDESAEFRDVRIYLADRSQSTEETLVLV
ncbi:ribosomal protein L11 methyltransferase [marine gamma proteobacterium HTCC2148]|jgi:predicted nicotinamide N-methyase|nr:ribosomal protein L11 methyltransferase [marine gamma proteobacterium HTCC2148]MBT3411142.1 methyltransferase [Halieaceae bacterium]MBT5005170.1 methyltransferase [Halieaceae bacterium]MBT6125713.1 methyltransferase [Halieaceae bacterium]